jgi:ADP-heptose:LPS heptosyltransferase
VIGAILAWDDVRVIAIEDPQGYGAELADMRGVSGVRPTLRQLLALLAEADVLVCNDSGPMHLAAVVGTPTVAISHPHAAREFAPLGAGHHTLKPDFERSSDGAPPAADALLGVSVADVVAAVGTVLEQSSRARCATGS